MFSKIIVVSSLLLGTTFSEPLAVADSLQGNLVQANTDSAKATVSNQQAQALPQKDLVSLGVSIGFRDFFPKEYSIEL